MISPKLYASSKTYDFFMKLLGYQSSIDRFLADIDLGCANNCRILDAGCGTGLMGLHFASRYDKSTLCATDLEANFLQSTLENANTRGVSRDRVQVGIANISTPAALTSLNGETIKLQPESFDLICIGAVVGYADNTESSLRQLVELLAPTGYLINLEMNESPTGRFVSHRYHYRNIKLSRMRQVLTESHCDVSLQRLRLSHLPAKFTRTAIIARKR